MTSIMPSGQSPFDSIRHVDDSGEYWLARELADKLGYKPASWHNFECVIDDAKSACVKSGNDIDANFYGVVKDSANAKRKYSVKDIRLTRYACYLIAQNADPTKEIVALAQTYFAVQTRAQELTQQEIGKEDKTIRAYIARGYSLEWATERVKSLAGRARLTQSWAERGGAGFYDLLTEMLHQGALDISTQEHLALKGFEQGKDGRYHGPLRDAMTIRELAIISFTESMAHAEHEEHDSQGIGALQRDVQVAGELGHEARLLVEKRTKADVVSSRNMLKAPDGGIFGDIGDPVPQLADASTDPQEGC